MHTEVALKPAQIINEARLSRQTEGQISSSSHVPRQHDENEASDPGQESFEVVAFHVFRSE